jgi:predicted 2-oxoglutarate/Fe(II)-dependent dioxygenase YbiX
VLLQVDRASTHVDPAGAAAARSHFDRHHWLKLPQFLDSAVMERAQRALAGARFVEVRHTRVEPPSIDVCMEPNALSALLELLCNDPLVLRAVESLTGCSPLLRFDGFVYRLAPGTGHHHNWHNDVLQGRRVAMSINLDSARFEGGVLMIRERQTGRILEQVENRGTGDAVLFRIDLAFQHRVTAVTDGVKTAFAGWFRSEEPFRASLARGNR